MFPEFFMISEDELKKIIIASFEDGWYSADNNIDKLFLDEKARQLRDYSVFKKVKNYLSSRQSELYDGKHQ